MDMILNSLEEYNYHRNELRTYSCIAVVAKVNAQVTRSNVSEALIKLIASKRRLRLNAFFEDKVYRFQELENWQNYVPLQTRTITKDKFDLVELLNDSLSTVFETNDNQKFLWKIDLINSQYLALYSDHLLLDGSSCIYVLEDLVRILNGGTVELDDPHSQYLLQEITTPSKKYIMSTLWKEFSPIFAKRAFHLVRNYFVARGESTYDFRDDGSNKWVINAKPRSELQTFSTFKKLIQIEQTDFMRLKMILRRENVTFTAFLIYCNLRVLSTLMEQDEISSSIEMSVPLNLRSLLKSKTREYGNYVSTIELVESSIKNSGGGIDWKHVQFINDERLNYKNKRYCAQLVGMLDYVDARSVIMRKSKQPRTSILEISNLGFRPTIKTTVDCNYIEELYFTQPNNRTGPYLTNDIVSTAKFVNIVASGMIDELRFDFFEKYCLRLQDLIVSSYHL